MKNVTKELEVIKIKPSSAIKLTFVPILILALLNYLSFLVRVIFSINTVSGPNTTGFPSTFLGASISGFGTLILLILVGCTCSFFLCLIYNLAAKITGGLVLVVKMSSNFLDDSQDSVSSESGHEM